MCVETRTGFLKLIILLICMLYIISGNLAFAEEARITNLIITNNDEDIIVYATFKDALPQSLLDGLYSGIPLIGRIYIEIWHYQRMWMDRRITSKMVENSLTYNVLKREYVFTSIKDGKKDSVTTKNFEETQKIFTEIRGLKLVPIETLNANNIYYVRVKGEVRSSKFNIPLTRLLPFIGSWGVESSWEKSPLLMIGGKKK